jgi:glycerol-3-phosphate acyltransferase PlsY
MHVLELGLKTLIAYLLGAVLGSLVMGRFRGVDIREQGSGNAGGTNALRTQGWKFALGVVVIDVGKALVAVGWLPSVALPLVGIDPAVDRTWLTVACAAAVVVGHVYPVWYEFRGGKGAATLIGAVAVISPAALVPVILVWLATVMLTGFVGLGTMLGTATLPVYFAIAEPRSAPLVVFGLAMAAFVAYTHRANIERMRAGNENRARRLWLLRPR